MDYTEAIEESRLPPHALKGGASAAHTELQQTHLQIVVRNTRHVKHQKLLGYKTNGTPFFLETFGSNR